MDPLSDILSTLANQPLYFGGLRAGGAWALRFSPLDALKFNAVLHGACWLRVDGMDTPIRLQQGDCVLLSRGRRFVLASDLALPVRDADDLYRDAVEGVAQCGDGEDLQLLGSRFSFGEAADLLLGSLPPALVIRGDSEQAAVLHWALQRVARELSSPSPGTAAMTQHLGHMMLVQALRIHLSQAPPECPGWLAALSEPRLAPVMHAIHAHPARRWTVSELSAFAGTSRSSFALRFKQVCGLSPLEYVTRWRMHLASRWLRDGQLTISVIAERLGYESDSAFSSAFKRTMKQTPTAYRARHSCGARHRPA